MTYERIFWKLNSIIVSLLYAISERPKRKRLWTKCTTIGFISVNSYMCPQIACSCTWLATMRTLERFLSCMNSWVFPKLWWWSIGLLTQWACKWFLTCMNSYVYLRIFWIFEGFLTHSTLKGAQAWDIRSLGFSWFLHHKVSTCGRLRG